MKRKIAILLSAMMVASAMPMTASAVQLKGDTDINAGFPKADQTIDTDYQLKGKVKYDVNGNLLDKNGIAVSTSNPLTATNAPEVTSSMLKDRYSVLKLNLTNDGTSGDIPANTTFKINLENGTFDEDLEKYFSYIQTSGGKLVTYDQATANETATSLSQVFQNVANAYNDTTAQKPKYGWASTAGATNFPLDYTAVEEDSVLVHLDRVKKLVTAADNTKDTPQVFSTVLTGNTLPAAGTEDYKMTYANTSNKLTINNGTEDILTIEDMTKATEADFIAIVNTVNKISDYNTVSSITAKAKSEYKSQFDENASTSIDLAHIPYEFNIESDKTASVTIPVAIKDSDKKVNLTSVQYAFDDVSSPSSITALSDFTVTGIKAMTGITLGTPSLKETTTTIENPYIALPLGAVKADTDAPVKVTVDGGYSQKVISGTYTITKGNVEGSTSLVFPDSSIRRFDENTVLEPIVIRENTKNTIGKVGTNSSLNEAEFTIRLDGGFKFSDVSRFDTNGSFVAPTTIVDGNNRQIFVDDSNNINWSGVTVKIDKLNDSALKFHVKGLGASRNNAIGFRFQNLKIEPINDNNFGDVTFTISGDGINTQSKVVAKREKLGFKLETTKDPQEIIVGRHYAANNYEVTGTNSAATGGSIDGASMLEKDNTTVEIKFSEAIPNTLVETRQLDFNVPDGVKIVDAKIYDTKNFNGLTDADFDIVNNGKTLRVNSSKNNEYSVVNRDKIAEFKMVLDLSIDPAFTGEIKLGVTGGGQSETVETVIAKAKAPFELKTQTTKANMGYQDYNTADIVITETKPGMFLENRTATLELVAPYGTSELGFSEARFEVSGGELEVKERDFKVGSYGTGNNKKEGVISFKINKASHKNPSTVTIKNVKVGTTRSVPYGSYSLALSGDAVINNFYSDIKDSEKFPVDTIVVGTATTPDPANLFMQNNTSYFEFKDYVNVITETGTLDHTVKVTVGEKTVLLGDKAIDMDVAPYIQASSNSTMVPLRFVSVALGVDTASVENPDASNKIAWDANTKTTTIYYGAGTGQKIIQFQAGSNIMTVDGTRIPMEYGVKAEIKDGRMFVPFRALGQALGVTVTWDADTRTAIYNESNARNANVTTTAASSTTTESTTESTTASTTTESTTASDSTTETTTAKK